MEYSLTELDSGSLIEDGALASPVALASPIQATVAGVVAASSDGSSICYGPLSGEGRRTVTSPSPIKDAFSTHA